MTCSILTEKIIPQRISSLAIMPHSDCNRNCSYCYEKKFNRIDSISFRRLSRLTTELLQKNTHIDEVLVDMNPGQSIDEGKQLINIALKSNASKVLVTTVPEVARRLMLDNMGDARFSLSIHNQTDVDIVNELFKSIKDRIECFGVMQSDLIEQKLDEKLPKGIDLYLMADKFTKKWSESAVGVGPLVDGLHYLYSEGFTNVVVDNCLGTQLEKQPCPAYTMVNLYADGSLKYCPYSLENESEIEDTEVEKQYRTGCHLIEAKSKRTECQAASE